MKMKALETVKFKKLQRRLGLRLWQTVGLLETLWRITERNAPQGNIGKLSNEDIAAALDWEGDESLLVRELIECGWLDESAAYRLVVHDWHDHAPAYLVGAFAKHGKPFLSVAADGAKQGATEPARHGASTPLPSTPTHTSRRQPETRLPDNIKIGPDILEYGATLGIDSVGVSRELERFKNHAATNDRRCRNWNAAFRNWLIKAAELNPPPKRRRVDPRPD